MGVPKAPVVVFGYNRPDLMVKVLERVRESLPRQVFLVLDGPLLNDLIDRELTTRVFEIAQQWVAEFGARIEIANENLGLRTRIESGLDWVFGQVDHAIILEDDCVPHQSFFVFCDAMLERYKHESGVISVTGSNFLPERITEAQDYYFSKYPHCWGWATWGESWQLYDKDVSFWPRLKSGLTWRRLHQKKRERRYWSQIFDRVLEGEYNSWAYRWTASVWNAGGLTVTPSRNLVENIGFDARATHTTDPQNPLSKRKAVSLVVRALDLKIQANEHLDWIVFKRVFQTSLLARIKSKARRGIPYFRVGR